MRSAIVSDRFCNVTVNICLSPSSTMTADCERDEDLITSRGWHGTTFNVSSFSSSRPWDVRYDAELLGVAVIPGLKVGGDLADKPSLLVLMSTERLRRSGTIRKLFL